LAGTGFGTALDAAAYDMYRNQLNVWAFSNVTDKPTIYEDFMSGTYYAADKAMTADALTFLAATNGSFTRASGGTMLDSAGNLIEFAAGVPRITDRGMGIESTGTNLVRNPRCEGAVVGSPGTLPTFMGWVEPAGITHEVVGVGSENGIPGIYLRIFGTTTAAGPAALYFEYGGVISALVNDTITSSVYLKSVAGTPTPLRLISNEYDSAVTYLAGGFSTFTPAPVLQRTTYIRTLSSPTVASVSQTVAAQLTSGQTIDFTFFVGGPQIEKAVTASSLILPPVGSPAQATRAAEDCIFTRAVPAAFSKAFIALPRRYPIPSGTEVLWQVDDGTSNNRIYVARLYTGSIVLVAVVGGVTTANLTIGIVAENTEFKVALRAAGNNWAASLNGAAVVTNTTSAMPTGLTYERLGNTSTGLRWNGTIKQNTEFPALLTNTQLQALAT